MRYIERNHSKRIEYLRSLRRIIESKGSEHIVYLDESGFERTSHRTHGWGLRGKKVHGKCSGNKRPRTSLISAKRGNSLLAPILFEGNTNATLFNYWLQNHLFEELGADSTILPRKDGQRNLSQDSLDQADHRGSWTHPSISASILT